ncbi:MAG: hypothetical protein KBT19_09360 [Lachnospiraceae bacterium]|nr:hypothetical protein [Candidatus Colinaster equi]
MVNRVRFGFDFTDGCWYVAEPYAVATMDGIKPFISNVTQSPGFVVPLEIFFKIFYSITGSTEGIVLFARMLYLCVAMLISIVTVLIVNGFTKYKVPWLMAIALFIYNSVYSLFYLNYNTIGVLYFPLICALIFAQKDSCRYSKCIFGIVAGIVATRATMATPQIVVGLIFLFIVLCIRKEKERIGGILCGCLLVCAAIVLYVYIEGNGIVSIIEWLKMFFGQSYFGIPSHNNWQITLKCIGSMMLSALLLIVGNIIICRNVTDAIRTKYQTILYLASVICGIAICIILKDYEGKCLIHCTWAIPYCMYIFATEKTTIKKNMVIVSMAYLAIYVLASSTNL